MDRATKILSTLILGFGLVLEYIPLTFAQQNETEEYTLEEITVTAEKRAQDLQKVSISVVALEGDNLLELGKITVAQILEAVPNLTLVGGGTNTNQIVIRGVKPTNTDPGRTEPPTTAVYSDGVYNGMGNNYDINRVEVLRGPQGTLYGRSAAGGVVAFHTNNPVMSEFSGNFSGQYGKANLIDSQAVINIPLGKVFALRVAGHYSERESYYAQKGGWSQTMEGRIKARYQPNDKLDLMLTATASRGKSTSSSNTPLLKSPTEIDYVGRVSEVSKGLPSYRAQGSLDVNYDFGESTLTYIAALNSPFNQKVPKTGMRNVMPNGISTTIGSYPTNRTQNQEIRWASDSEGPVSWLIGSNYYKWEYQSKATWIWNATFLAGGAIDPDPNAIDVISSIEDNFSTSTQYGIFTEETYKIQDNLRVTGGLRFDKTKVVQDFNLLSNSSTNANGSLVKPENLVPFMLKDEHEFSNVTYKARVEYDFSPSNMVYAVTATGYLPGNTSVGMQFTASGISYIVTPSKQERLTSYEIGTKNRFLNGKLQVNSAAFYNDYEGYQQDLMIFTGFGPPTSAKVYLPVRMIGLELDSEWLVTMNDKVSISAAWVDAKIREYPDIEGLGSSQQFMLLRRLTGIPPWTANLGYDHTFMFGDGSTLVPRAQLRFTGGYYTSQVSTIQKNLGELPYSWQGTFVLGDIGATWNASNGKYSVTANVRNITDEEYKVRTSLNDRDVSSIVVNPGDPRTYGMMFSIRF